MRLDFQHLLKPRDYTFAINYRRFIPIFFTTILIILFFTFRQYQFQSSYLITSIHKSLNETINSTNQTNTINSTNQTNTIFPLTKMIVVSHYNEDLDWLDLSLGEQIPHIVYTRASKDPLTRHNIPINTGRDPAAYLRYIIDHYSNLPSLIAFVHAHRTSWHQSDPDDIVVALRAVQWNKYNFMPLNSFITHAQFNRHTDLQSKVNYKFWRDFLQKELGPPPKNGISTHCCATFIVKREVILAHPKMFYSKINDYLFATKYSDQLTSRALEYTWHMIFGEPAHIAFKTCDIFVCDSKGRISVELAEKRQS